MKFQMSDKMKNILEWVYCVVIALILALLIRCFVGTPTVVQHVSMVPTLEPNERLLLNKIPMTFNKTPERGDIVTFVAPSASNAKSVEAEYNNEPTNWFQSFKYYGLEINKMSYIKRVVALPGEHVELKNEKVYINGVELKEEYVPEGMATQPQNSNLVDFVVPSDSVFLLGDNRVESLDSRAFGCIPLDKLESKVLIRFWPLNTFGTVE